VENALLHRRVWGGIDLRGIFITGLNKEALLYSTAKLIEEDKTSVTYEVPCKYQAQCMFKHKNNSKTESHFLTKSKLILFFSKKEENIEIKKRKEEKLITWVCCILLIRN